MRSIRIVSPAEAQINPYPYIRVNDDGTARELHPDERRYLEAEYAPGDGNLPWTKRSYDTRDGWGKLGGYMERAKLPGNVAVAPAPAENPFPPMGKEGFRAFMREKGWDLVDRQDGTATLERRTPPDEKPR